MSEPAAAEVPAATEVPSTELKPAETAAAPAAEAVPAKEEVNAAEPQKPADAAAEVVEPQNALTQKFTDAEWKALKELRVSSIVVHSSYTLNDGIATGRVTERR